LIKYSAFSLFKPYITFIGKQVLIGVPILLIFVFLLEVIALEIYKKGNLPFRGGSLIKKINPRFLPLLKILILLWLLG